MTRFFLSDFMDFTCTLSARVLLDSVMVEWARMIANTGELAKKWQTMPTVLRYNKDSTERDFVGVKIFVDAVFSWWYQWRIYKLLTIYWNLAIDSTT